MLCNHAKNYDLTQDANAIKTRKLKCLVLYINYLKP